MSDPNQAGPEGIPASAAGARVETGWLSPGGSIAAGLAALGHVVFTQSTLAGMLRRVLVAMASLTSGSAGAGLTIGAACCGCCTPVATSQAAAELESWQTRNRCGPVIDGLEHPQATVLTTVATTAPGRWREFATVMRSHGVASMLTVGLGVAGDPPQPGSVSLYAHPEGAFAPEDRYALVVLAAHAAAALAETHAGTHDELEAARLPHPLESREVLARVAALLLGPLALDPSEAATVVQRAVARLDTSLTGYHRPTHAPPR
jgi:hypothetical protein